jgi:hypothetical protein
LWLSAFVCPGWVQLASAAVQVIEIYLSGEFVCGADMKVVCEVCQTRYSLPNDKIQGRTFKFRCKLCRNPVLVCGEPWPYGHGYEFDVFIVYTSADYQFVHLELLPALDIPTSRVLLFDELTPGELLVSEIERGISSSRFTVVVLSPAYLEDRWAVFGEQLASHLNVRDSRIIPLMIAECRLPLRLDARVALDFTKRPWSSEVRRLRDRVRSDELPVLGVTHKDDAQAANSGLKHHRVDSMVADIEPENTTISRKLELVDVSFDDYHDACEEGCEVLDFKMINQSRSSMIIKRIDIIVQNIWTFPPTP